MVKEWKEGMYMALASALLFMVKLPVGFIIGHLLEKYCLEDGPHDSQRMWFIIGMVTLFSPIILTFFWNYLSKTEHEIDYDGNEKKEE